MQKIKIREVHIKNPCMELEYYLLLKGGVCGIEIRDAHSGEAAVRFVPDVAEKVYRFLVKLAKTTVTPVGLDDMVDDYIYEHWQSQCSLYLLQANPRARLDRGKRNVEAVGDLRTGVAANEG